MIKEIAWDTFKKTGDINTFLELKQIEVLEKEIKTNGDILKSIESIAPLVGRSEREEAKNG